jgi:ribonuclease HI
MTEDVEPAESVESAEEIVVIHTDGGCRPNPGPGGWGAVLRQREHVREMCGGESGETSNNRMELTAPIKALEALTRPVVVHLYTDSTYVRNGITKWVLGWERNGWKTAAKQPVKNVDLWKRLQLACSRHQVEWFWVKGHSGVADNELADELATRGLLEAIDGDYSLTTAGSGCVAGGIEHHPVVALGIVQHLAVETQPAAGRVAQSLDR